MPHSRIQRKLKLFWMEPLSEARRNRRFLNSHQILSGLCDSAVNTFQRKRSSPGSIKLASMRILFCSGESLV